MPTCSGCDRELGRNTTVVRFRETGEPEWNNTGFQLTLCEACTQMVYAVKLPRDYIRDVRARWHANEHAAVMD